MPILGTSATDPTDQALPPGEVLVHPGSRLSMMTSSVVEAVMKVASIVCALP